LPSNHVRFSPASCSCTLDLLIDTVTGNQTLFAIRNLCDAHLPVATTDPNFQTKKQAAISQRYQQLEDNRTANYAQIDAYTDLQMSPDDKSRCKSVVDRITAERKAEYDLLLSQPTSNLLFCVNVHDSIKEENGRWPKIYDRVKSQFNLTDAQMQTITWSFSGNAPNRTITVVFGSLLTTNQKNTAQAWCDTNIGAGRVIIQ
jgi:hypothetical protein